MIEDIFKKTWFKPAWHIVLIIGVLYSGFFMLEGWKINKKNILLVENNLALTQSIEELKNQNSFVNLDSFRDKTVKGSGYKYPGEQVIDTSKIDTLNENETNGSSKSKPNQEKWIKCIFGKNENIFESVITSCR
jgi:DNA-binding winged helix-turn-helix (wHTH) protein